MTKTDKKLDKQICQVLTNACEMAKDHVPGFQWLTHRVNFKQFPDSLTVICVFQTQTELEQASRQEQDQIITRLIKTELGKIDIRFKDIKRHVLFVSEEKDEFAGKWK